LINVNHTPRASEDFELIARKSFFVAVCDCDETEFIAGYGCIHPFHVIPGSVIIAVATVEESAIPS